jgi:replicative DNA helicase
MTALAVVDPREEDTGPRSLEAEQAVLGSILFDNRALDAMPPSLSAHHFHEPVHGRLFTALSEAVAVDRLADAKLIAERMKADGALQALGGVAYLLDLIDHAPPAFHAAAYAESVLDTARRRDLIKASADAIKGADDASRPAFDLISEAENRLAALLQDAAPDESALVDARTAAQAVIKRLDDEAEHGRVRGALTGLRCFDYRLGGIRPGHLNIIAGRPSMGKTGLARAAAIGCARKNPDKLVAFFTLEMDRDEISERTLSQLSHEHGRGIPYREMEGMKLDGGDRAFLSTMASRVPANFILDDTSALSVEYVRRRLLTLKRKGPIAAAFIDYLQIMKRPERQGSNDASILGAMTAALKQTAREVGCGIVLLSQLSRQVESRDNKRPMLSDLRESGAIEQDANAVLFAYRGAYYIERRGKTRGQSDLDFDMEMEESRTKMEVICAKQRRGPVGTDEQRYVAECDVVQDVPQ